MIITAIWLLTVLVVVVGFTFIFVVSDCDWFDLDWWGVLWTLALALALLWIGYWAAHTDTRLVIGSLQGGQ